MSEKYPKGSRFLRIDLNKTVDKEVLDAMLDQQAGFKIPISGVEVDGGDIRVTDMQLHFPYMIVIFHLIEGASVVTQTKTAEQLILPGTGEPETHEQKDLRIRREMAEEDTRKKTTIQR